MVIYQVYRNLVLFSYKVHARSRCLCVEEPPPPPQTQLRTRRMHVEEIPRVTLRFVCGRIPSPHLPPPGLNVGEPPSQGLYV